MPSEKKKKKKKKHLFRQYFGQGNHKKTNISRYRVASQIHVGDTSNVIPNTFTIQAYTGNIGRRHCEAATNCAF